MKSVFLTGATGAIGSALVPLYLNEPDTAVKLLLRAKRGRAVAERLAALGEFWDMRGDDPRWARVEAIVGDAALPRFGMEDGVYERLSRSTSHIVHCAGAVKMTLPLEEARAHAVVPAQAALELAERNRDAGVLQKVELVSTVGVGGRTPGLVPERPMPEVARFHNTYEAAKAEAEQIVFARWNDLPITIHRPSMVVGDSSSGKIIHFQVFYHLCEFLSGQRTSGLMPSLAGATLDVIPVDYVARAIHWSSLTPVAAGRILHLCSGPQAAVRLPDLVTLIRSRAAAAGQKLPKLRPLPLGAFRVAVPVLGLLASEKVKRALSNLELFLAYLDELQTFANTSTAALLEPAGIRVPRPSEYLDAVLSYYQQRRR
ncbi:MAG: SDR family oxidoreductase [Burkholderiales bacterium]|nr:SDR family oxidoreductase [Burkholderiales bacterium]